MRTATLNVPIDAPLKFKGGEIFTIEGGVDKEYCICGNPARVLLDGNINLCFFCYNDFIQRSKEREYCKYCGRGIKRND